MDRTTGSQADQDRRLLAEIRAAGADLDKSVLAFRRHRLSSEAEIRVPECADLPRFVSCTDWDHRFPGTEREVKVRWVFDRRLWSVVVLHRREAGGVWSAAGPDELLDVTESLVFANADALFATEDWGCAEERSLPGWTAAIEASPRT
ncbi:hypothetical protein [Aureimonas phyllosphaerae]|uniref:Uncharacterized protein n=1 Tax=Aureimonas phyllosphaerae TaxID=1166078 RepID=A0A7W6BWG1_9HYPH|nr:hypothetical protein [Aureimonas phyllosphaerae]MBB3937329.1 hypothetical protein [Aureimonas phyllosphaerae]MBB3961336.1 hypothetical protein [Aureimonas phyllosphaerae]SFF42034.1 hypothetical protein SAMN05216566_11250 [Aureimonas phyllosphaerae]